MVFLVVVVVTVAGLELAATQADEPVALGTEFLVAAAVVAVTVEVAAVVVVTIVAVAEVIGAVVVLAWVAAAVAARPGEMSAEVSAESFLTSVVIVELVVVPDFQPVEVVAVAVVAGV